MRIVCARVSAGGLGSLTVHPETSDGCRGSLAVRRGAGSVGCYPPNGTRSSISVIVVRGAHECELSDAQNEKTIYNNESRHQEKGVVRVVCTHADFR